MQQVVSHGTMRVVANGTIFLDGRVLVDKRALLFGVTSITNHIDGVGFQVSFGLSVRIVAIGTRHLPFPDGMMGRQLS